jgi:hypothetical protein
MAPLMALCSLLLLLLQLDGDHLGEQVFVITIGGLGFGGYCTSTPLHFLFFGRLSLHFQGLRIFLFEGV